ncbi:MAG TPA: hypothetical protein VES88_12490 [Gemmatimonadaceae bacterium]|nr:hypothetical protein [Gemmatimonadaceae bacterium]
MSESLPYWAPTLAKVFSDDLIRMVLALLAQDGPLQIDAEDLTAETTASTVEAEALLKELAKIHVLVERTTLVCGQCKEPINEDTKRIGRCSTCETSFDEVSPVLKTVYYRSGSRSRDVQWVVTIHGMNTRGGWQQEFAWQLAQVYGYSVPVAVYKYGRIAVSPLLQFRQWKYRDRLIAELRRLQRKRADHMRTGPPDVIAHSFGTWLLAQALLKDENLVVGRIILTGSIVRPDFNWRALIDASRVEAVLCHSGGRDRWVRAAQFGIPMSGPSGHRGFNDRTSVAHVHEPEFSHSDFFDERDLSRSLNGVWASFLTVPQAEIALLNSPPEQRESWRPSRLRNATPFLKVVLLGIGGILIGVVIVALLLGVRDLTGYSVHLISQ